MTGDPYKKRSIKSQVERGLYRVDPRQTADAMIRWFSTPAAEQPSGGGPFRPQNECSYPDSGPSASTNVAPGVPSTTDPIQVKPLFGSGSF